MLVEVDNSSEEKLKLYQYQQSYLSLFTCCQANSTPTLNSPLSLQHAPPYHNGSVVWCRSARKWLTYLRFFIFQFQKEKQRRRRRRRKKGGWNEEEGEGRSAPYHFPTRHIEVWMCYAESVDFCGFLFAVRVQGFHHNSCYKRFYFPLCSRYRGSTESQLILSMQGKGQFVISGQIPAEQVNKY